MRLHRVLTATILGLGLLMAGAGGVLAEAGDAEPMSKECIEMRQDVYADVGTILAAGCQPTTEQMSRLMDNPLGNVAMWINQLDVLPLTNDAVDPDRSEVQTNYMGILQFPKGITKNWNLINRIVYNIPSSPLDQDKIDQIGTFPPSILPPPGPVQPPPNAGLLPIDVLGGRTSGFGDMVYLGLASPKEGISHGVGKTSVWGLGAGFNFPSASEDVLGSGKWSAGPSALYAYLGQKWKLGTLVQTYFSFAGDDDRNDVTTLNMQLFYYYSITPTISIGAGPNIIADFEADSGDKWTVPLGIGIGYTRNIGKIPFRFMFEYYGSVVRPDTVGTTHDFRFLVIPAIPAGLIPFLR